MRRHRRQQTITRRRWVRGREIIERFRVDDDGFFGWLFRVVVAIACGMLMAYLSGLRP